MKQLSYVTRPSIFVNMVFSAHTMQPIVYNSTSDAIAYARHDDFKKIVTFDYKGFTDITAG